MNAKPLNYLKETWDELGKVTWPTKNEVIKMSLTVIIVSGVIALFITLLDIFLTEFVSRLVNLQI